MGDGKCGWGCSVATILMNTGSFTETAENRFFFLKLAKNGIILTKRQLGTL